MHELAAKFGALALSPFFFFGGHATTADAEQKHQQRDNIPAWQQIRSWAGGERNQSLAIKGIEGPSSLAANAEGEWTVNVKSRGNAELQYSVVWGDEGSAEARSLQASSALQSSATFSHTYETEGTYKPTFTVTDERGRTATKSVTVTVGEDGALRIDSLSAAAGAVGSEITVYGAGFTGSSTVTVGGVSASNVEHDEGSLTFTVPSLRTGEYNVRVWQGDERSNPLSFTVTAAAARLSISGVDAPVRLAVGAEGTWTVHATTAGDNLRYSVVWGDEGSASMRRAATSEQTQSSAEFTHTYEAAGTYKPKFTVTDVDSGRSASVSASVVVR